jgi:hypothetical protein
MVAFTLLMASCDGGEVKRSTPSGNSTTKTPPNTGNNIPGTGGATLPGGSNVEPEEISSLTEFSLAGSTLYNKATASEYCRKGVNGGPARFGTTLNGEEPRVFYVCLGDKDEEPEALRLVPAVNESKITLTHYAGIVSFPTKANPAKKKSVGISISVDSSEKTINVVCTGINMPSTTAFFTLLKQDATKSWEVGSSLCGEIPAANIFIKAASESIHKNVTVILGENSTNYELKSFPTNNETDPNYFGQLASLSAVKTGVYTDSTAAEKCGEKVNNQPVFPFGSILRSETPNRFYLCTGDKEESLEALAFTIPPVIPGESTFKTYLFPFYYRISASQPYKAVLLTVSYNSTTKDILTSCSSLNRSGQSGSYTRLKQDVPDTWLVGLELCQGLSVDTASANVANRDKFDLLDFRLNQKTAGLTGKLFQP